MVAVLPWSALLAQRYRRLGVIGRGATGTVYRALDRLTGRRVALKSVHAVDPSTNARGRRDSFVMNKSSPERPQLLEREFKLLAGLRHPNIIATLDFGRDEIVGPFFTMDLEDDSCTLRVAAGGQPLGTKVDLLVQLLHALAYLHRRGLAHRDLKPENALCSRGVLKLIDLGLAAPLGQLPSEGEGGGTLAYAAPELVRGAPPSERTDLYAFGVIAYELLAGCVPFDARSPAQLLQAVFRSSPDCERPGIDPRLAPVLRRLLTREPSERFADAFDVIAALSNALGRPLSLETTSTRESFLQGASLVGRDNELELLRFALPTSNGGKPTAGHAPRAVLVAGESGVGKSRLLEELAIEAMLSGVQVLRGQALREGSRPYEPWRGVLRHLVLLAPPSKLEAGIIASIVPDISSVLQQAVPPAPELDPEATQIRLVRVLEALLRRCRRPLLLLLEDLQWAGTESLKLFTRTQALSSDLPVSIVASFRDDERPNLPREVSGASTITLGRFSPNEISRLCASMLGERSEDAKRADLAELVHRRSEGNAFVALEVIRSLANEAGGLERVVALPLAERLDLPEATEHLVHRRVERLSERERVLLQTAAIAGRELDLSVLGALHPDLDVEDCAARAVEAAVLASAQGRWWFAHDKLRDVLIEALPDHERRQIHRGLAYAILAARPADASTLAHHFAAAGETSREKEFSALAGDQFLRSGAYHEAIPFLQRARALAGPGDPPLARAVVERRLGEALFRSGQLIEARDSLGRALAILQRPLPRSRPLLVVGLVREALIQVGLRARRERVPSPAPSQVEWWEETIRAYTELTRLAHHLNDEELVLLVTLSALNLSERGALLAHHARLAAVMGAVMGLAPVHRWARFYFAKAESLSARLGDPTIHAFVLAHRGYYEAGIGQWAECEDDLERSRELYDRVGDVRLAEESISILAYALFFKGDLERSMDLYRLLHRSGEERGDGQIVSWGLTNSAKVIVREAAARGEDDLTAAEELLKQVDGVLIDGITSTVRDGVAVELELARGDLDAARETALDAATRLERSSPRSFMAVSTYAAISQALLASWRAALEESRLSEARDLRRHAIAANRALTKLARVFPIAEPARLLHEGTLQALCGRTARARALWARAAALGSERTLPFEENLARAELARSKESADPPGRPRLGFFDRLRWSSARDPARRRPELGEHATLALTAE